MMTTKAFNKYARKVAEEREAKEFLQRLIPPGTRVYTSLKHVSRSGMMRHIQVLVPILNDDGTPTIYDASFYVAKLMESKRAADGSIKVSGCGMDMGFHVVYNLASLLGYTRYHRENGQDAAPYTNCYGLSHSWL